MLLKLSVRNKKSLLSIMIKKIFLINKGFIASKLRFI